MFLYCADVGSGMRRAQGLLEDVCDLSRKNRVVHFRRRARWEVHLVSDACRRTTDNEDARLARLEAQLRDSRRNEVGVREEDVCGREGCVAAERDLDARCEPAQPKRQRSAAGRVVVARLRGDERCFGEVELAGDEAGGAVGELEAVSEHDHCGGIAAEGFVGECVGDCVREGTWGHIMCAMRL